MPLDGFSDSDRWEDFQKPQVGDNVLVRDSNWGLEVVAIEGTTLVLQDSAGDEIRKSLWDVEVVLNTKEHIHPDKPETW